MSLRPCLGTEHERCGRLTSRPDSRCEDHARQRNQVRDQARGSRQARGYDAVHDRLRARLAPHVRAGLVDCARCGERILPGQRWALDHRDDRSGYLGPSHLTCNAVAAGSKTPR